MEVLPDMARNTLPVGDRHNLICHMPDEMGKAALTTRLSSMAHRLG
ncbi:MAG TPA: hypothetical protein VIL69_02875 [Roseomonas sp.]|jgi:hypothetical protein